MPYHTGSLQVHVISIVITVIAIVRHYTNNNSYETDSNLHGREHEGEHGVALLAHELVPELLRGQLYCSIQCIAGRYTISYYTILWYSIL